MSTSYNHITRELLIHLYHDKGMTISEIANQLNKADSTIRYHLRKFQIKTRSKSEAQKRFLLKKSHQRLGHAHSRESREKISNRTAEFWSSDEGAKTKHVLEEKYKNWWNNISDTEKMNRLEAMAIGQKERAGKGSRFENYFADYLVSQGFVVEQRTSRYTPLNEFVVDIALPNERTIVEIDGPVHFEVVFDQETLDKHQKRDNRKNKTLVQAGLKVVRVQTSKTTRSVAKCKRIMEKLLPILNSKKVDVYYIKAD